MNSSQPPDRPWLPPSPDSENQTVLTTQALVERFLTAYADRTAVVDGAHTLSFAALADRSARLANACLARGAGAQRPVAIYLGNDFHFIELDLACMRAGITRVGISSRLSPDECQFIVNHSRAAVLVTTETMLQTLDVGAMDGLTTIALVDHEPRIDDRTCGYEALLSAASATLRVATVGPDHPAYVLYTSGTTGRPKGALHTHGSRVAALVNMLANELRIDRHSGMVHAAALTHGSGSKVLSFLAVGARNIILPRFDPELFAQAIVRDGGTHSFAVPTMLQMLGEGGPAVRAALKRMRQMSFGGAPITNTMFGRALEAFGPNLTQVYGTSEAPHPLTVLRPDDYAGEVDPSALAETAGRPSLGIELAIVDDEGQPLPRGQEGELIVRGEPVMKEYWLDPKATAEVFTADGWYRTGDVAVLDEGGFVRFRDRKRDLIISGGLNVYPSEVERAIAGHPAVREVAVVGYPDERWGESVMAYVVPATAGAVTGDALITWLEGRIAGYKKPRRVEFIAELPKGSTNKVLKRVLKERVWAGQARRIN